MLSCSFPDGVSVSKFSVNERNAMLCLFSNSTILRMSSSFLLILFSFQTTTKSNLFLVASSSSCLIPGLLVIFFPLIPLSSYRL